MSNIHKESFFLTDNFYDFIFVSSTSKDSIILSFHALSSVRFPLQFNNTTMKKIEGNEGTFL